MKLNYKNLLLTSAIAIILTACGSSSKKNDDKKDVIVSEDKKSMLLSLRGMSTGLELWTTDGTEQGTNIIKDVNTIGNDAKIDELVKMNRILYFRGYSATYGEELWRSDGTKEGTYVLKDIWEGSSRSRPSQLTVINNTLYFVASDIKHGKRLWKSDGTKEGTIMIDKEFALSYNNGPSHILHLTKVGDTLFFSADDGVHGMELWKSDGTVAGTVMVKDVYAGEKGHWQSMSNFIDVNGRLYFTTVEQKRKVLWTSDATEAGTHRVSGFTDGYTYVDHLQPIAGLLYCNTKAADRTTSMWRVDENGAKLVLNIPVHNTLSTNLIELNGMAYFFSRETTEDKFKLWRSDGTNEGTVKISDKEFIVKSLKNINGAIYFKNYIAEDNGIKSYAELWKIDSEENITKVESKLGHFIPTMSIGDKLIGHVNDAEHGFELWISDGTDSGTKILKDIKLGRLGSRAGKLLNVNGTVYFTAQSEVWNYQLWKTDGTEEGTVKVASVDSGTADAKPSALVQVNETYYFVATDGVHGRELWKSDGTEAGTKMVKDIINQNSSNAGVYGVKDINVINDTIYFNAVSIKEKIFQMWKSDGSENGTVMIKDFPLEHFSSGNGKYNTRYFDINGTILFRGYDSEHGVELWTTDGTSEGTKLFKDINKDENNSLSDKRDFLEINDVLYFKAYDPINGKALWRSDGTKEGTIVLLPFPKSYDEEAYRMGPDNLTDVNGTLFFTMNVDRNNTELWKSDGSKLGTTVIKRFKRTSYFYAHPYGLTNINGILYFIPVYGGDDGWELWKSDGTSTGTTLVTKVGKMSSYNKMGKVTLFKDKVYFSLPDNTLGTELWVSDGTQKGTKLFKDFRKGKESSYPNIRGVLNGSLIFEATDDTGRKLWKTDGTVEGIELVKSGFR